MKEVNESSIEYLIMETVAQINNETKLDQIGFRIGQSLIEKYTLLT
jgi:hypothetical protein